MTSKQFVIGTIKLKLVSKVIIFVIFHILLKVTFHQETTECSKQDRNKPY